MSQTCCNINPCQWFQQHFALNIQNSDQGLQFDLNVNDPQKAEVLQNLVTAVKNFCQAFCKTC